MWKCHCFFLLQGLLFFYLAPSADGVCEWHWFGVVFPEYNFIIFFLSFRVEKKSFKTLFKKVLECWDRISQERKMTRLILGEGGVQARPWRNYSTKDRWWEYTAHCYHRDRNTNHAGGKAEGRLASQEEPKLAKKQWERVCWGEIKLVPGELVKILI